MFYSILPVELHQYKIESDVPELIDYKGCQVEYTQNPQGHKVISRIHGTDLKFFLDDTLKPGSIIDEAHLYK